MCIECDAGAIATEADELYRRLLPLTEASRNSNFSAIEFGSVQSNYRGKLVRAFAAFQRGNIDAATLESRWASAMNSSFTEAYRIGSAQHEASLTGFDRDFIKRAIRSEMGFASNFIKDIGSGKLSEKQILARLDQYPAGLDSIKTSGWVQKGPPDVVYIWRLGIAMHCSDCGALADLEFTRDTLPTVPRAGDTCVTTPESRVFTRRGWVPIVDVRIGDEVMTHLNRWRRVTDTPRNESAEGRLGIEYRIDFDTIGLTADHLVRVYTACGETWTQAANVNPLGFRVRLSELVRGWKENEMVWFGQPFELKSGTVLYDLTVEEDHSFVSEGGAILHNSCRGRCKCHLEIKTKTTPKQVVSVRSSDSELTSGRKTVGRREPSQDERATIDDLRAQINYHRRRIETAENLSDRRLAIDARKAANSKLIEYTQQRGIRDVPMLDVSDVLTRRKIEPDVALGMAVRGLDGTTISFAQISQWNATQKALLTRIEELIGG